MTDDTQDPVRVYVYIPVDWKPVLEQRAKRDGMTLGVWLRHLALSKLSQNQLDKLSPLRPRGAASHEKNRGKA